MSPNDNELVSRAQHGETVAFEQLIHRYDRKVLAIATRYTGNIEDAQDVYQEVFLRVYRGLSGFRFKSQFSTWLFRVTTNVCLSYLRKHRKVEHVTLDADFENRETLQAATATAAYSESPEKTYKNVEISEHVNNALAELSAQQRLVFILKHYEHLKLSEIAETMDCAEGTVKRYLYMATQKLRTRLMNVFE